MRKKVCRECKIFVDGSECPICKGTQFSTNWKGRIAFLNAKESMIAKKISVEEDGEYVIKVR